MTSHQAIQIKFLRNQARFLQERAATASSPWSRQFFSRLASHFAQEADRMEKECTLPCPETHGDAKYSLRP